VNEHRRRREMPRRKANEMYDTLPDFCRGKNLRNIYPVILLTWGLKIPALVSRSS